MKALTIIKETNIISKELREKINSLPEDRTPVDHLASLMNILDAEADEIKRQESRLAVQRKIIEGLIQSAKESLKSEMLENGMLEVAGSLVKYSIRNNPPKLLIEDESMIPEAYKQQVVLTEIKKGAIKDDLKLGIIVPGCKLVKEESIQIGAVKG